MCVQRLGTVEWYTVTIRCMLVAWAWPAVLELYDSMPGVCMWGLLRAGVGVFFQAAYQATLCSFLVFAKSLKTSCYSLNFSANEVLPSNYLGFPAIPATFQTKKTRGQGVSKRKKRFL